VVSDGVHKAPNSPPTGHPSGLRESSAALLIVHTTRQVRSLSYAARRIVSETVRAFQLPTETNQFQKMNPAPWL
jgi:hypothetical protein